MEALRFRPPRRGVRRPWSRRAIGSPRPSPASTGSAAPPASAPASRGGPPRARRRADRASDPGARQKSKGVLICASSCFSAFNRCSHSPRSETSDSSAPPRRIACTRFLRAASAWSSSRRSAAGRSTRLAVRCISTARFTAARTTAGVITCCSMALRTSCSRRSLLRRSELEQAAAPRWLR
jgi:hypothetical protein